MNLDKCGKCGKDVLSVEVAPIVPAGQYGIVDQEDHPMHGQRVRVSIAAGHGVQYVNGDYPHGGWYNGPVKRVLPIGDYTPNVVWFDNELSDDCPFDDAEHDPNYDGAPLTQEEVTTPAAVYSRGIGPWSNGVNQ